MTITVNGEPRSLDGPTTLAELLDALGLTDVRLAAEVNRQIVPRAAHAAHGLADGDAVEIVTFVGGG